MEKVTDKELVSLCLPTGGLSLGVIRDIQAEYQYAAGKFPPFRSIHEGLAILEEELHELRMQVYTKKAHYPKLRKEAIQVATMALRFVHDVCDERE